MVLTMDPKTVVGIVLGIALTLLVQFLLVYLVTACVGAVAMYCWIEHRRLQRLATSHNPVVVRYEGGLKHD